MNIQDLKQTLIDTGNPFVWITEEGWFFNEQRDSVKYSASQILAAESFENIPEAKEEVAEEEINEVVTKKRRNK